MKICFIWIDKFRNFENLGFNLSSSVKFFYDINSEKLIKTKIDPLPENFFGETITDVVGVIGKNGSGKSNAVELVCKMLKGSKTSLQGNFFIITEVDKKFTCHYSFTADKNTPITNFDIDFEKYSGNINPLKVVFFSNVFDGRRNDFDNEVSDVSVNNLHSKHIYLGREKANDFEKQIKLIDTNFFSSLNIDLPTKIQFTTKDWLNRINPSFEKDSYRESYEIIRKFKKKFKDRIRDIKPENKFIHLLRVGFFFEIYNNYSRRSRLRREGTPRFESIGIEISKLEGLRTTDEITEKLISYLQQEVNKATPEQKVLFNERDIIKTDNSTFEKIKKQIEFIKNTKYYISNLEIEYNSEGLRNRWQESFTFNFKPNASNDFINAFVSLFADNAIFDIKWLGISSGHKAYLNLFASLHQELKRARQSHLLLCIDEGDLYLHPKWQIEFFDKLLNILPIIYSGKVQLILTSHSPFLLSDLPKQNITILDKGEEGLTLDGVKLNTNTFGGNLYNLYSEPFFLGNKRMSDFAYNKIKNLIDVAENKTFNEHERIELIKISKLIGDEIIKFRLKELLNDD